jgi:hypothetical protein
VVTSAVQIIYIRALPPHSDLLSLIPRIVVCGQVVQVTSIMTSTIPFLKPFLMSLESSLVGPNGTRRATTSAYASADKTGHASTYIKIGSQQSRNASVRRDKVGDIWVQNEIVVKREELGIELMAVEQKIG